MNSKKYKQMILVTNILVGIFLLTSILYTVLADLLFGFIFVVLSGFGLWFSLATSSKPHIAWQILLVIFFASIFCMNFVVIILMPSVVGFLCWLLSIVIIVFGTLSMKYLPKVKKIKKAKVPPINHTMYASYILMIINTACTGILLIPLLWTIPMTLKVKKLQFYYKKSTALGVCSLIFTGLFGFCAGVMILCNEPHFYKYNKNKVDNFGEGNKGLDSFVQSSNNNNDEPIKQVSFNEPIVNQPTEKARKPEPIKPIEDFTDDDILGI